MAASLIVNADDFGQTRGINRGIVEAFERGLVTSASLMVTQPAASEAAGYARRQPALSVGLHVDLGEWHYRDGQWIARYERVDRTNPEAIESEVRRQLDRCGDLLGHAPTHIDSHQHVHRSEPARSILAAIAAELRVPLRHYAPGIRYCGEFYGQTACGAPLHDLITTAALLALLDRLPDGVTELACHPGYADGLESVYAMERTMELRALCAHEARAMLSRHAVNLVCFAPPVSS